MVVDKSRHDGCSAKVVNLVSGTTRLNPPPADQKACLGRDLVIQRQKIRVLKSNDSHQLTNLNTAPASVRYG